LHNNDVWSDPDPDSSSPCNNTCSVNSATGFCGGCWRTLKEIREWSGLSEYERIEVKKLIEERKTKNES